MRGDLYVEHGPSFRENLVRHYSLFLEEFMYIIIKALCCTVIILQLLGARNSRIILLIRQRVSHRWLLGARVNVQRILVLD